MAADFLVVGHLAVPSNLAVVGHLDLGSPPVAADSPVAGHLAVPSSLAVAGRLDLDFLVAGRLAVPSNLAVVGHLAVDSLPAAVDSLVADLPAVARRSQLLAVDSPVVGRLDLDTVVHLDIVLHS